MTHELLQKATSFDQVHEKDRQKKKEIHKIYARSSSPKLAALDALFCILT